jgi:hypothetical protein
MGILPINATFTPSKQQHQKKTNPKAQIFISPKVAPFIPSTSNIKFYLIF